MLPLLIMAQLLTYLVQPEATPTPALDRGVWIASVFNLDWPTAPDEPEATRQAEFARLLDAAQKIHTTDVYVQVRPTADTFWPSQLEPFSRFLTTSQPTDDPLKAAIAETHRRGLRFHAWFNPYRIGDPAELAPNHPARRHPDWTIHYGNQLYFDPGEPAARDHVRDVIMEVVDRYDIDGVHLDDYFYPYPIQGVDFLDDASFQRYGAGLTRPDWRRENVNYLIASLHNDIRQAKPQARFGISPFGIWRNDSTDPTGSRSAGLESYDAIYADTRRWIIEGWIDYVIPQLYWRIGDPLAPFEELVRWWAKLCAHSRVTLYIGHSLGKLDSWNDPTELPRQQALIAGEPTIAGDVFFRAGALLENPDGLTDYLATH